MMETKNVKELVKQMIKDNPRKAFVLNVCNGEISAIYLDRDDKPIKLLIGVCDGELNIGVKNKTFLDLLNNIDETFETVVEDNNIIITSGRSKITLHDVETYIDRKTNKTMNKDVIADYETIKRAMGIILYSKKLRVTYNPVA